MSKAPKRWVVQRHVAINPPGTFREITGWVQTFTHPEFGDLEIVVHNDGTMDKPFRMTECLTGRCGKARFASREEAFDYAKTLFGEDIPPDKKLDVECLYATRAAHLILGLATPSHKGTTQAYYRTGHSVMSSAMPTICGIVMKNKEGKLFVRSADARRFYNQDSDDISILPQHRGLSFFWLRKRNLDSRK